MTKKEYRQLEYTELCINYILEHEEGDYLEYCEDNNLDASDYINNPHIYAAAVLAQKVIGG
jgi:hypothetical protein